MAQLMVNTQHLRDVAAQLKSLNSTFLDQLDSLRSTQQALNGQWEGPSHDNFNEAFQRNAAEFDEFNTLLNEYIVAMENFVAEYERAEQEAAETAKTR